MAVLSVAPLEVEAGHVVARLAAGAAAPRRARDRREPHLPAAATACASPARSGSSAGSCPCSSPARIGLAVLFTLAALTVGVRRVRRAAAQRRRDARRRRRWPRSCRRSRSGRSSGASGRGSIRSGRASSGAPRCRTRSSRWSRRRGSRSAAAGTPALAVWLRTLGARIGRGVWCDSYWLPEADLVTLGDGSTVNRGCVVQTHLFHDRIMSMDRGHHRAGRDARARTA